MDRFIGELADVVEHDELGVTIQWVLLQVGQSRRARSRRAAAACCHPQGQLPPALSNDVLAEGVVPLDDEGADRTALIHTFGHDLHGQGKHQGAVTGLREEQPIQQAAAADAAAAAAWQVGEGPRPGRSLPSGLRPRHMHLNIIWHPEMSLPTWAEA